MIAATRPSTLAKTLDSGQGLMIFEACTSLQEVGRAKDLLDQLRMVDSDDWHDYKPVHQEAQRRRGKPEANQGTNVHRAVEALAHARRTTHIPKDVLRDAHSVFDALAALGLTASCAEEKLANLDSLPEPIAGTCDLIVEDDNGGLHIADVKTVAEFGNARYRALAWSIQLACYAAGQPCNADPDEPWERDSYGRPLVDPALILPRLPTLDRTEGLVIEVKRGTGETQSHVIDLEAGWRFAELACAVRAARKAASIETLTP